MAGANPVPQDGATTVQTLLAWLVHLFTGTGAILALLALVAVEDGRWVPALMWLLIALMVDGVDGSLARWARVKERAPRIDGDTLDLVIDYLTFVFVPTLFMLRAGLIPEALAPWLAAGILLSALYVFARTDMKTEDGYFRGFPALWNLVAFYLFVVQPGPAAGAVVVVLFIAMSFAPIHFVHPFRVRDYGVWLPILSVIWTLSTCALLWRDVLPNARPALMAVSIGTAGLLFCLGLWRTVGAAGRHLPKEGGPTMPR